MSNRSGAKTTTDGLKCLDINWLNRSGYLVPGYYSVSWSRGERPCGDIRLQTFSENELILLYRYRQAGGEWEDVKEPVCLSWKSALVYLSQHALRAKGGPANISCAGIAMIWPI